MAVYYERLAELSLLLALPWCSQYVYASPLPQDRLCGLTHALSHVLDRALVAGHFAAAALSYSACCWRGWRRLGALLSCMCFIPMLDPAPVALDGA